MKSGFKTSINGNKFQSKVTINMWNPYLDYLVDPSFQEVNRFFVLLFKDNLHQTKHTGNFLPKVEIKDYNFMIDR